ncbi:MAG TPA: tyramine oxidase, partial [Solirubrobacteraceae bacterium]|nr:tyramine oxidase [Solirubrobacteraceae bacterium]
MSSAVETTVAHPLDPLSADEIARAVAVVRAERGLDADARFGSITLVEPDKRRPAEANGRRRAELIIYDRTTACVYEAIVVVTDGQLEQWTPRPGVQSALTPEEYLECEELTKAHPDFQAALRRRGIDDLDLVTVDPIPTGNSGLPEEDPGRRVCRTLAFVRPDPGGNSYGRPIEGVFGIIDLGRGEVIRMDDLGIVDVPDEPGEYRADRVGPLRSDLRPVEITQPEGPSFTVEGNEVAWQKWRLRVGFTPREGLVLHTVGYEDSGRLRPILHRASFAEMAVPYAEPSRYYQSPFDIGENYIGTLANSLALGCDCLGTIRYFDADMLDSRGKVVTIKNAVCLHEEDFGLLWKHYDWLTGTAEVRRCRRLVVSSIVTVDNYEYAFYWYLYQDGTIESECKLTGIVLTSAVAPGERPRFGRLVEPGLSALNHQHF